MIYVVAPTISRARLWCNANGVDSTDRKNVVIFPADLPLVTMKGKNITAEDKVVWISDWKHKPYASQVEAVIRSCITEEPEHVYA